MTLRQLAIILVIAIAVPALLLVRLLPTGKIDEKDKQAFYRSFGRSQIWFYGGVGVAAIIILLLEFC